MSASALLLLAAVVAVAAFVQGASGLGFALIVAPVAGLLNPGLLPVMLLAAMIPLNLYIMLRERGALDLRGAAWISVARIAATPGGSLLLLVIPERHLGMVVGLATVLAALASVAAPAFTPGRGAYMGAGVITGLTETTTGVGGPPLALVYQHRPPSELRATVALCFLVGEVVSLAMLLSTGQGGTELLRPTLLILPAVVAGVVVSRFAHRFIDASRMRVFVLGFALVSGVVLMLGM
ncbi:hypothetical protein FHX37_3475 [Haloactinospora alba]|uniref:Probable membrane transporter protein n=1 Tax=Haloactinospora alba TaxID=405555 RepID=A0A543NNV9_9ACTN|nr:sulfite exporter TauE/SafE family protein [Haloactinospora alba]TQN33456.1 hypothetical protein FHX37_3475 [Haloactinospora alba]